MKLYFTLFSLLLSVATISAAENDAPLTSLAPAAAPVQTDSLPTGRHKVSSYRNGSSIEVIVENRKIQSLKVDGKDVPENEYDQHQDRVEELLGTNENGRHSGHKMRMHLDSDEEHFEGLEEHFEGMGEHFEKMGEHFELRFEGMGENFEKMGERLGESFERMFDFESNGNVMRFEFRGDGNGNWHMDTLGEGRSFEWHSDGMDPKGLNSEMPANERGRAEQEIREMETMIQQMERQKARMKADLERDLDRQSRDLERQKRDLEPEGQDLNRQGRDLERQEREIEREEIREERSDRREASYEVLIEQLQREGLIEDTGRLRKLTVDVDGLKVNGKKASKEGHARFLELYEQQTGKALTKASSISVKID